MRACVVLLIVAMAVPVLAGDTNVFVSESETTIAIGGAPWRVYLDAEGETALDRDGDSEPDRFAQQYTADQAAKAYLRAHGGGEAFTGLAGVTIYRHTVKGRWLVPADSTKHTFGPGDLPPPEGVVAIYIDAPGGPTEGDDANDGLTPASAIASWERLRQIALQLVRRDAATVLSFRLCRGDTFPALGRVHAIRPKDAEHLGFDLSGTADQYLVITGYGEGDPPIMSVSAGETGVLMWTKSSYIEVHGIAFHSPDKAGTAVRSISQGDGLRIIDCRMVGATTVVTPKTWRAQQRRFDGFEFIGNTVERVHDVTSGHRQGLYVSGCGAWRFNDNVFYDVGWIIDADGARKGSTFNHGLYAAAGNLPVAEAEGNIALYCSGAGMQFRAAGNVRNNFVAFCGDRGINWGESRGTSVGTTGGHGEFSGNVVFCESGHAITVSNLESGRVHHNTGMSRTASGMVLLARAEIEKAGGEYRGLNDTIVEHNALAGSEHNGAIQLSKTGWNHTGAGPVVVRRNKHHGAIKEWHNFADTRGGLIREDNAAVDLSAHAWPEHTPKLVEDVLARRLTAADLIKKYGAHH